MSGSPLNINSVASTGNRRVPRRWVVLGAAMLTTLFAWLFRDAIQGWVVARGTLANDAPAAELLEDFVRRAANPDAAILACWNSGKVVHREFAARQLAGGNWNFSPELESVLLSGALDPDLSVRESALSGLRARQHPALISLAAAQLRDPDPQVRLLGLDYLKHATPHAGIPLLAPVMADADLRVAGRAVKLLERWSGEEFDLKLVDTVEVDNPETGLKEFRPEGMARTRAAVQRAQAWWSRYEAQFPPPQLELPPGVRAGLTPIAAGDFRLPGLDGRMVRLAEFRGKTVILNFWATWCTACLSEIPALVALQKRHEQDLVVLGISLDYVPDTHGHFGDHGASGEAEHDHGDQVSHDHAHDRSLREIRDKVDRMVKRLGINYPVLLDERNVVGSRFNGGELPTTVLIDPEGNIRRRFMGARPLPVFEAMLAEILEPAH